MDLRAVSFDNYTLAGDVAVIAICAVIGILLFTSYVSRTRSYRMFVNIVVSVAIAAAVNISYHELLLNNNPSLYSLIYALRILYQALLFEVFFLFALYVTEVTGMERKKARFVAVVAMALFVAIIGIESALTINGTGFRITEDGTVVHKSNLFMIGYLLYVLLLAVLINRAGNRLYKRVIYGFYGTMAVSLVIRFTQMAQNHSSLTTMTFVFPVIAMLYIMHSTPYNVKLGSVDASAMEEMVRNMHEHNISFIFLSLLLPEYDEEGKQLPEEIRAVVRKFAADYFRGCVLFQISNGHVMLIAPKKRNPDFEQRIEQILKAFRDQYQRFKVPYKVVVGESIGIISRKNEYVSLVRNIERGMQENTVHRVGAEDINRFNHDEYILHELADIYARKDLDDPRVLTFCQPVFNIRTGEFDTAEALMRLKLDEAGLVFPDHFIPIAEAHGYIHVLTEIILHKTCQEIRRLADEGFRITRVSVNVSVLELKDGEFCGDISRIIEDNHIPGDKIAIELTESNNEADFLIMKNKIEELHKKGIQFYLDDFGTGYSNMERIMELPFDIIKFDRSLVIASGSDKRSEKIVEHLANMFREMDYSVLYEGVEDDIDEERCREMSATFLQGYKYSRPVPIEKLREFLPKAG